MSTLEDQAALQREAVRDGMARENDAERRAETRQEYPQDAAEAERREAGANLIDAFVATNLADVWQGKLTAEVAHEKAKIDVCEASFWRDEFDSVADAYLHQTPCTVEAGQALARVMAVLDGAIAEINCRDWPASWKRTHIDALTTALSNLQRVAIESATADNIERAGHER